MISVADIQTAVRNLSRNRRRALVGLLTIACAVIALVLTNGFIHWVFWLGKEVDEPDPCRAVKIDRIGVVLNDGVGVVEDLSFHCTGATEKRTDNDRCKKHKLKEQHKTEHRILFRSCDSHIHVDFNPAPQYIIPCEDTKNSL